VAGLDLNPQPLTVITPVLSHPRAAVRKRATQTLAQYIPLASADLFQNLLASEILPNLAANANIEKQRTTVGLVAAVARTSPQRIVGSLPEILPGIVKATSRDDDDLREGCLQVSTLYYQLRKLRTSLALGAGSSRS
jgi:cullin-associated NEDD8-dissociated protein 1